VAKREDAGAKRRKENGQGWIRTSEGVKPADLQSAPFGHFGTYPRAFDITHALPLASGAGTSLFKKLRDALYHVLLRFTRDFGIDRQGQAFARGAFRFRKIAPFVAEIFETRLLV
jgi:hypothetical protein